MTGKAADWDRRLVIRNAPAFAIIGEEFTLKLMVEDVGAVPASQLGILVRVGGAGRGSSAQVAKTLGMAPWQVDKARRSIGHWDGPSLGQAIQAVAAADVAGKGGGRAPVYAAGGRQGPRLAVDLAAGDDLLVKVIDHDLGLAADSVVVPLDVAAQLLLGAFDVVFGVVLNGFHQPVVARNRRVLLQLSLIHI